MHTEMPEESQEIFQMGMQLFIMHLTVEILQRLMKMPEELQG